MNWGQAAGMLGSVAANPIGGMALAGVGSYMKNLLFPDERLKFMRERALEVLNEQRELMRTTKRQSQGNFTAAERESIRQANEPTVNAIAEGVGARGLGASGAGGQVVADAQEKPFTAAQQQAQASLSHQAVAQAAGMVDMQRLMSYPDSFRQALVSAINSYQQMSMEERNDPIVQDFAQQWEQFFKQGGGGGSPLRAARPEPDFDGTEVLMNEYPTGTTGHDVATAMMQAFAGYMQSKNAVLNARTEEERTAAERQRDMWAERYKYYSEREKTEQVRLQQGGDTERAGMAHESAEAMQGAEHRFKENVQYPHMERTQAASLASGERTQAAQIQADANAQMRSLATQEKMPHLEALAHNVMNGTPEQRAEATQALLKAAQAREDTVREDEQSHELDKADRTGKWGVEEAKASALANLKTAAAAIGDGATVEDSAALQAEYAKTYSGEVMERSSSVFQNIESGWNMGLAGISMMMMAAGRQGDIETGVVRQYEAESTLEAFARAVKRADMFHDMWESFKRIAGIPTGQSWKTMDFEEYEGYMLKFLSEYEGIVKEMDITHYEALAKALFENQNNRVISEADVQARSILTMRGSTDWSGREMELWKSALFMRLTLGHYRGPTRGSVWDEHGDEWRQQIKFATMMAPEEVWTSNIQKVMALYPPLSTAASVDGGGEGAAPTETGTATEGAGAAPMETGGAGGEDRGVRQGGAEGDSRVRRNERQGGAGGGEFTEEELSRMRESDRQERAWAEGGAVSESQRAPDEAAAPKESEKAAESSARYSFPDMASKDGGYTLHRSMADFEEYLEGQEINPEGMDANEDGRVAVEEATDAFVEMFESEGYTIDEQAREHIRQLLLDKLGEAGVEIEDREDAESEGDDTPSDS